ncbi:MAG: hypothetical protein QXJ23_10600 [Thermofilum sp.]|uniref:hypothetical protein n=1 Tax=Thermofilum sp. TaxID=1961369 RepID=UPI003178BC92
MVNREKIIDYVQNKIDHISDITDMVLSRIRYGDPILFQPIDDLGINPTLSREYRKKIIKMRRQLLGLEYREYVPKSKR